MTQTDHSLQMYRSGVSMGHQGHGASRQEVHSKGGYVPGKMMPWGSGDTKPIMHSELEKAHQRIRLLMQAKYKTFRKAFRALDFDGSGKVERGEALRVLMNLHLTDVREPVLFKLMEVADLNKDGMISYDEFCTLLMAEDPLPLASERFEHDHHFGGPWSVNGGPPLSQEATFTREHVPNLPKKLLEEYKSRHISSAPSLTRNRSESIFVHGKPFDRQMWMERNRLRRQEEILAKNQPMLRRVATPSQLKRMSFEEGMVAISMYKQGGASWEDWKRQHPTHWYNPNSDPKAKSGSLRVLRGSSTQSSLPRVR